MSHFDQELFETSIVWGRQKMVESEEGWDIFEERKIELEEEVRELQKIKRNWETELGKGYYIGFINLGSYKGRKVIT